MVQYLYSLVNKANGSTYFGITNNFKKRMQGHKHLSNTFRIKTKLYNSIRKHGWENFEKEIVSVVKCRTEVLELEKFYIVEFDTMNNGLNTVPGGAECGYGRYSASAVKIRSYNIITQEEGVFECMLEAAEEFSLDPNAISKVVCGRIQRTGDYMFQRYDPDYPDKPFDASSLLTREETVKKASERSREVLSVPIIGTRHTGFTIEFEAARDAERVIGISSGHISECCQGKRGYAGGYVWIYKDETLRSNFSKFDKSRSGAPSKGHVYRILEDGTKDTYISASDAQTKLGIKHVQRSVEMGHKSGGYNWFPVDKETYFGTQKRQKSKGPVFRILEDGTRDGTRDEYATAADAERKLNIKHVRRAIDTETNAGGCRWYNLL
ncbi:GIY-YIG catalytic domain-containing endonuclease [Acanthocystis turfacea Chlorella virus Canal-1]|nr:GIY-YIG catalytic domain-containing endonuclease [Acanthocystis turfacea Chlorella virus Canal-1]